MLKLAFDRVGVLCLLLSPPELALKYSHLNQGLLSQMFLVH